LGGYIGARAQFTDNYLHSSLAGLVTKHSKLGPNWREDARRTCGAMPMECVLK